MDTRTALTRLGDALRQARRRRGYTQARVAEMAALPRLKIIQIERGEPSVSMSAYASAAAALDLELLPAPARRPTLDEIGALFADD